mgnify:CR=1 FL=1
MTFAPEMDPDQALEDAMRSLDIRAQMGHSLCDYATARDALARGCGVTHMFNAMSPLSHRDNGLAGAALAHAANAEIIPDLIHVEPGAILAARRKRVPVLLDGYVSTAAALVLAKLAPGALDHCRAAHRSAEPAHARLLEALGLDPLLDLGMRLGEASGAALAVGLLKGAAACHTGMATFDEAGVSEQEGS